MLAVVSLLFTSTLSVRAQIDEPLQVGTFVTPFPENDVYRMQVIGDAYAEGILWPLLEAFGPEQRVDLQKRVRGMSGMMRQAFEDEARGLDEITAREAPHVAVVMLGAYDRLPVRNPQTGRAIQVGTPEWREVYSRRVDRVMKSLRRKRVAVYWIGLPVVRRPEWNEDVQMMNEIIREKAFLNGVRYIDAYTGFIDDSGNYDNYGPDLTGKIRRMREGDGLLFTADGNRKLAHFVERELKRDLGQARSERSIPLLGSETEQKRISPRPAPVSASTTAARAGKDSRASAEATSEPGATRPAPGASQANPSGASEAGSVDQRADNGRIALRMISGQGREETVTIDLPRPSIAGNVMALLARQQAADRSVQIGETVNDEIAGGLIVMSSVSPATPGRRRQIASQSPYFRVLVRGERLAPKPGRVDDFRWPRVEQLEEPSRPDATQPSSRSPQGPSRS